MTGDPFELDGLVYNGTVSKVEYQGIWRGSIKDLLGWMNDTAVGTVLLNPAHYFITVKGSREQGYAVATSQPLSLPVDKDSGEPSESEQLPDFNHGFLVTADGPVPIRRISVRESVSGAERNSNEVLSSQASPVSENCGIFHGSARRLMAWCQEVEPFIRQGVIEPFEVTLKKTGEKEFTISTSAPRSLLRSLCPFEFTETVGDSLEAGAHRFRLEKGGPVDIKQWDLRKSETIGNHYRVARLKGLSANENGTEALRATFPEGKADDRNFVLFSTSGMHGSYQTIEDVVNLPKDYVDKYKEEGGVHDVTFLQVQISTEHGVCLRYGNCQAETPEDIQYLKELRASSHRVMKAIGIPDSQFVQSLEQRFLANNPSASPEDYISTLAPKKDFWEKGDKGMFEITGSGMAALREIFPDGEANDLNIVLFSAPGLPGADVTIEQIELGAAAGVPFVYLKPRQVSAWTGTCIPETPEDVDFLRKLRDSSHRELSGIGKAESGDINDSSALYATKSR
jgi:hypothetical protein